MNLEPTVKKVLDTVKEMDTEITIPVPAPFAVNVAMNSAIADWHAAVTPKFLSGALTGLVFEKNPGLAIANGLTNSAFAFVESNPITNFLEKYERIKEDGAVTVNLPVLTELKYLANTNERDLVKLGTKFLSENIGNPLSKSFNRAMHNTAEGIVLGENVVSAEAHNSSNPSSHTKGNLQQAQDLSSDDDDLPLFGMS